MIKYLKTHEYAKIEDNIAYIGISEYAAKQLGNVVYVDMPDQGDDVTAGGEFGAIESVKAASDLYSPLSGAVLESNELLIDNPSLVNKDPINGWIIKIELTNLDEIDGLMTEEEYDAYLATL